jgi:peptidoglycan/LPS O-acetylase OafA/YrhL
MKRIEMLDYGRLLAAICVILFHYSFNGIQNGKITSISYIPELIEVTKYGYLGVEFFFMISGYVIFFSANRKTAGEFLTSRAIRLFPAFWAALAFTTAVTQFWGTPLMSASLPQALANLSMFPQLLGYGFVDGAYWTLQYEWKFYLLICGLIIVNAQHRLQSFFILWPVVILLGRIPQLSWIPFTDGYYGYFAAGALFAIIKDRCSVPAILALALSLYLCISYSTGAASLMSMHKGVAYSEVTIALIMAVQFAFFLLMNSTFGSTVKLAGSKIAGNLTYPLYLVHAHFGYMLISRFANEANKIAAYCAALGLTTMVAYTIHLLVERKLAATWRTLFSSTVGRLADAIQAMTAAAWVRIRGEMRSTESTLVE